jgi:hypothetical protein
VSEATRLLVRKARANHPPPWTYKTAGGIVSVVDSSGKEVPLFFMLDLVCALTQDLARSEAPATKGVL